MANNWNLSDFLQTYGNNADTDFGASLKSLGIDPANMYTYEDNQQVLNPAIAQKLNGYTVSQNEGAPGSRAGFSINDASGNAVGNGSQYFSKDNGFEKFMYNGGALALPLLGGMALGSLGVGGAAAGEAAGAAAAGGAAEGAGAAAAAGGAGGAGTIAGGSGLGLGTGMGGTGAGLSTAGASLGGNLGASLGSGSYLAGTALEGAAMGAGGLGAAGAAGAAAKSGGLLSSLSNIGGPVGSVASWMKENPGLSKAIFSAGTGLLASNGAGLLSSKNPVNWSATPARSGSITTANQMATPGTLKATGNAGSGAWRYLLG